MKTVQVTLEPELVDEVDRAVARLGTSRSGFTRDALRRNLVRLEREELERRHREGYARHPVEPGEFDVWEDEQAWGD
jgi:metal-responsive CopG/Arc/MetJ family transcriptional regulator